MLRYAVERYFRGKRYKSLTLDVFVSVSRLNQGYFALYCVTLLWTIHVAVYTKQSLCVLPALNYLHWIFQRWINLCWKNLRWKIQRN